MTNTILCALVGLLLAKYATNKVVLAVAAFVIGVFLPLVNFFFTVLMVVLAGFFIDSNYMESFLFEESLLRAFFVIPRDILFLEVFAFLFFWKKPKLPGRYFVGFMSTLFVALQVVAVYLQKPMSGGEYSGAISQESGSSPSESAPEELHGTLMKIKEFNRDKFPIVIDAVTKVVGVDVHGSDLIYKVEVEQASTEVSIPQLKRTIAKGPCTGKNMTILMSHGARLIYDIRYLKDSIDVKFAVDKQYCDQHWSIKN